MLDLRKLNQYRVRDPQIVELYGVVPEEVFGFFRVSSPIDGFPLKVLAANGGGWDHVSVSRPKRPPNWREMDFIKRLFFLPEEVAMQLHVPAVDHINVHPNCLHLWRSHDVAIPLPPKEFV